MATYQFQPIITGPAVAPLDDSEVVGNTIRYVGSSAPNTSTWAAGDLWADTVDEATAIILRRWSGTAFIPARGGGGGGTAPLLTELFTGSDGAAWSASWTTGRDPSTGTGDGATILSNQGKLTTSNTGGYASTNRISRRADIVAPVDVNMTFSFKFDSTECFPQAIIRSTTTAIDGQTGYYLAINKGTYTVAKRTAYVATNLTPSPVSFGFAEGTLYSARFYVVGTAIKARIWLAADAEPSVWGYDGTDGTYTLAGSTGFTLAGGNAATNSNFYIDNVTIESS